MIEIEKRDKEREGRRERGWEKEKEETNANIRNESRI